MALIFLLVIVFGVGVLWAAVNEASFSKSVIWGIFLAGGCLGFLLLVTYPIAGIIVMFVSIVIKMLFSKSNDKKK